MTEKDHSSYSGPLPELDLDDDEKPGVAPARTAPVAASVPASGSKLVAPPTSGTQPTGRQPVVSSVPASRPSGPGSTPGASQRGPNVASVPAIRVPPVAPGGAAGAAGPRINSPAGVPAVRIPAVGQGGAAGPRVNSPMGVPAVRVPGVPPAGAPAGGSPARGAGTPGAAARPAPPERPAATNGERPSAAGPSAKPAPPPGGAPADATPSPTAAAAPKPTKSGNPKPYAIKRSPPPPTPPKLDAKQLEMMMEVKIDVDLPPPAASKSGGGPTDAASTLAKMRDDATAPVVEEKDEFEGSDPKEVEAARRLANYGVPPKNPLLAGVYAVRVFLRQRELSSQLVDLRRASMEGTRDLERKLTSFGESIRVPVETIEAYAKTVQEIRQMEAIVQSKGDFAPPEAHADYRKSLAALGRQALADTTHFGLPYTKIRDEVGGLDRIIADRARAVRIHELTLRVHDRKAENLGRIVVAAALGVLVLLVLARPIYFAVFPPKLPAPLPADDVSAAP